MSSVVQSEFVKAWNKLSCLMQNKQKGGPNTSKSQKTEKTNVMHL